MNRNTIYVIYLCVILFSLICGVVRYKRLTKSSRILILLLTATLLSETIAGIFSWYLRNNMPVYHVYAPVHFFIVAAYFNYSVDELRRKNTGLYIGFAGLVLSILNTAFLQPLSTFNSYYLMFSGFTIITMSLFAFYRILANDSIGVLNNPHFWFSAIILFFWSTTYVNWLLYKVLGQKMMEMMPFIGHALLAISALTYFSLGLVYLFYPKENKIG